MNIGLAFLRKIDDVTVAESRGIAFGMRRFGLELDACIQAIRSRQLFSGLHKRQETNGRRDWNPSATWLG